MVGGYTTSLLAEMKPFTLDLETLYWRCWPGVKDGDTLPLPTPRQRMAAMRITHDWFLVSGGSPTSVRPLLSAHAVPKILVLFFGCMVELS